MFFFFKQKTSYEMRISDWSSDVCSSDLGAGREPILALPVPPQRHQLVRLQLSIVLSLPAPDADLGSKVASFFLCLVHRTLLPLPRQQKRQIGRASCRERVCQYV